MTWKFTAANETESPVFIDGVTADRSKLQMTLKNFTRNWIFLIGQASHLIQPNTARVSVIK